MEVQLAASLNPGRQGEFSSTRFQGDQVAKQKRAFRDCQSLSMLSKKLIPREGKGLRRSDIDLQHYLHAFSLITLISLFWHHLLWLIPA